jgi:thiamine-monophosphate kinase
MREREVLRWLRDLLPDAGDDCAILPFRKTHLVLTTDLLWRKTDLPEGATAHAIGWRAVAVSLSDVAAMGAEPLGVLLALGAPEFHRDFLEELLQGVLACCQSVKAPYLGGDLSRHSELTLVSFSLGEAKRPVRRHGAQPGELLCVTGALGRTAAALKYFEQGDVERANLLFEFTPRVAEGVALAPFATSMIDISDGLARSLYQLSEAGQVGFRLWYPDLPILTEIDTLARDEQQRREMALYTGEDFELLFTLPPNRLQEAQRVASFTVIGEVTAEDVSIEDGERAKRLEDRGYEH